MNRDKHLTFFFDKITADKVLNPTHISLYMSLFQIWNRNKFISPVSITRSELMLNSKINSKSTYHKCMKTLQEFGYIKYEPSHHPFKSSQVHLFDFSKLPPNSPSQSHPEPPSPQLTPYNHKPRP